MPSWKDFLEQLAVVKQAWIPFTLAVLFAFGLVYAVENWAYSSILAAKDGIIAQKDGVISNRDSSIASLSDRIKLRDDQLADKIKSTTPDEAKELIARLKKQVDEISPKHISENQEAKMIRVLSTMPATVAVAYDASCGGRCQILNRDLLSIFARGGWQSSSGVVMGPSFLPKSGIAIRAPSSSATADKISEAFNAGGIPFDKVAENPVSGRPEVSVILTEPQ